MRMRVTHQENKETILARAQAQPQYLSATRAVESHNEVAVLLNWQRTQGNHFVQRLLNESVARGMLRAPGQLLHHDATALLADQLMQEDPQPPQEKENSSDLDILAENQAEPGSHHEMTSTSFELPWKTWSGRDSNPSQYGVKTILRPRQAPQTFTDVSVPANNSDSPAYAIVAPGGAPAVNNNAASNDCTPSTASAVLNWNVVSADANNWRADVTSLTLAGQINIKPWPSHPNSMVVPNTPNPVDGGNINNTPGSTNHWQAAIDDMADYNSPGGGAGPNWHSTAASSAHEWAHWNTDYVVDSVSSAAGGNWPQTNADLDALREPKANSATAADARTVLQPQVNARMATWRSNTISRWNAIPDSPGVAGSTGYAAGMAVLNTHIAAIRAYATSKGW